MDRCSACGAGEGVVLSVERAIDVSGHRFTAELPARRCAACDEVTFSSTAIARFELSAAAKLAEAGDSTGEAFRFMRRALGMSLAELADLLGTTADSLARWETYDFVYKSAVEILGGLVLCKQAGRSAIGADPADLLLAYHAPRPLAKAVRIEWREDRLASG